MESILIGAVVLFGVILIAVNIPWKRTAKDEKVDQALPEEVALDSLGGSDIEEEDEEEDVDDELDSSAKVTSFKQRFHELRSQGKEDGEILEQLFSELDLREEEEELLSVCVDLDCSKRAISVFFVGRGWNPSEVAHTLADEYTFSLREWAEFLFPIVKGDTSEDRGYSFVTLLREINDAPAVEDYLDECLAVFSEEGISQPAVTKLLYEHSDASLGEIVQVVPGLSGDSSALVSLVQGVEHDLKDDDNYRDLCETGEVSLETMACVFRLLEMEARSLVECESSCNGSDDGRLFPALTKAGYSNAEALRGMYLGDDDETLQGVITMAFDEGVSDGDIVTFLQEENISPEDVDEALREEGVDLRRQVALLHAYFSAVSPLSDKD